jgi:Tol biopolymer transport system component
MPAAGVPIAYFIVYYAQSQIAGNTSAASQEAVAAASRSDVVTLETNSGVQHFAVSAVSYTGIEGPLSTELAVDTTSRIATRSTTKTSGVEQLQIVSPGGLNSSASLLALQCSAGSPGCTASQFTAGQGVDFISWSPMGTQVAYVAHLALGKPELWMVNADGQSAAFNVSGSQSNGTIVTNGKVGFGAPIDPAWAPDGSGIAFVGDLAHAGVKELWFAPNTPVPTPLPSPQPLLLNTDFGTDISKSIGAFEWSPDGSAIAYLGNQGNAPSFELFVVSRSGGTNTKLSGTMADNTRNVSAFAWSPDGSRLAFLADRDTAGMPELYVVGPGGGSITKVSGTMVSGSFGVSDFRWSPKGDRIAFVSDLNDPNTSIELYDVAATGGGVTKLSGNTATNNQVGEFLWSPDGTQVAFDINDFATTDDVFFAAAGGGGVIASGKGTPAHDVDTLRFSRSGELAFRWDRTGGHYDLFGTSSSLQSSVDMTNPVPALFTNANYNVDKVRTPPAWSPDGNRIAFLSNPNNVDTNAFSLFVTLPGGQLIELLDAPGGRSIDSFAWSPLGSVR